MRFGVWMVGATLVVAAVGCEDAVTFEDGAPSSDPSDPSDPTKKKEEPPGPKTIEGECGLVDIACPDARPFAGSPCQGSLSCTYDEDGITWTNTCADGAWTESADCGDPVIGGDCSIPTPAERCDDPSMATVPDAAVEVGPASGVFRPFADGEAVSVDYGGQGSAMLWYRLRIDGQDVPRCVRVTTTLSADVFYGGSESVVWDVTLRCGDSLGMYTIVPFGECDGTEEGAFDVTLTVAVEGVGEMTVPVKVPVEAVCGFYF